MSPKKRRGIRRKKKEDAEKNEDSFDAEDTLPSSQNLVESDAEKEEKDVVLTIKKSSKIKQNTLSDDLLQIESSPSPSLPILRKSRSLKESNYSTKISWETTETEEPMEIDDKNESRVDVEYANENTKNLGEKESLEKTESVEVDDETQVVEGNSTSLNSENRVYSEITTKKMMECKEKLISLGDIVNKTEEEEPCLSDVNNSDIGESKLGVELVKEPLDLKDEKKSEIISNFGNEVKNSVIDNSLKNEIVNTESDEMSGIHKEDKNLNECTSADNSCKIPFKSIPALFSGNLEDATRIEIVSTEEAVKDNISSLNEPSSSIKSYEKSNTSTADTPIISGHISSEVCDKIESSTLYLSSPAKNSFLSLNKKSIKTDELLRNVDSDVIDVNKNADHADNSETEADQFTKPTFLKTKVNDEPVVTSITKLDNSEPAAASKSKIDNDELIAISKIEATDQITSLLTTCKSEVDQIEKLASTSKMKEDNAQPITISKTEADLTAKPVATFGTDVDENGQPAPISELGVNIEKSVSTSKTEIDIEISASTSKAEVNKNEKFTTIPKTEADQNESSAVSSKTEVNVSGLPTTDTITKSDLNKDSSVSSKTDTNEKSESPKAEADKNENSAVASKTEVNASGLLATETNTKSNLNENSSVSSKTNTNEKSEPPSKAEADKREKPALPSQADKRSESQKNQIPGRGYIIGTRDVAEDKKPLFDCVLCFSGKRKYGVPGAILNKHIKSKKHALKVMELENPSLYKQFKDYPDAKSEDVINALLEFEETQKKQALLLATEANYLSQRQYLIKKIAQKKCDAKPNSTEITSVASTANADDTVSSVPSRKRTLSTEHVEAVPAKAPVALNTLSFLSSFKENDKGKAKELETVSKKTVGEYNPETLIQQLAEKKKGRHPDKIVLVMDDRDVFLCAEKLGKFVRVIRKRDLDFAKAVELVKSDFWFGKGTLFMFLGGVCSSFKIRKHSSCSKYKCEIPVYIYHIVKDTPPNIIDEALRLDQTILDNTADDQVLFCDLVPVDVNRHNELKVKNRLCYSMHPIDFHEKVPIQIGNQYTTSLNEFNKFVGKHTEKMGFKFESLLDATFGRNVSDVKYALENLTTDGVTFNEADYKRRCSSILSKVEAIIQQLHSVASKSYPKMTKTNKENTEDSNEQFDKVAIFADNCYKETLTQFSSDKVLVYAEEDLKLEDIEQLILEKKKSLPEKTLWLTLIGSLCISEIKNHDACQAKLSCKEPLITLVSSANVQNPDSLLETIRGIKDSTLALLEKVRSLIGPKSAFFIIPPYPPTIISESSFSHDDLHTFKCPDTQIYVASDEVINVLNSAFTKLNKEMISLVMKEFESHKLKCSSVESYNRSLPAFGHLQIVRRKSDSMSKLFSKWQDCVKGMISEFGDHSFKEIPDMISEFGDHSLKEIPVPVRNIKKFDHLVFIGHQNLLSQLSFCSEAKPSIFNINYPINFEFLQMKLSSLKSVSNKPMLFVIACDFTLIAKEVFDAKCNSLKCSDLMSYFASDSKDFKTVISDKLVNMRNMILKIKDTYPVNATVIIAPLFPRYCVERPADVNETVHRSLHVILKHNCSPCVVDGPEKFWEDGISLLQYYLRDEVLSNLYISNDHEPLTNAIESFLSVETPYIKWINPAEAPTVEIFKYNIKTLFDKLYEVLHVKGLNVTSQTTSSSTSAVAFTETKNNISASSGNLQNASIDCQVPTAPYIHNAMNGPYNTFAMNQGFYPYNPYFYFYPNYTPFQQMPSVGIHQSPLLSQVPSHGYQYPPPQQEVPQYQFCSATADESNSNNFINTTTKCSTEKNKQKKTTTASCRQSQVLQPSISDVLSSSGSQVVLTELSTPAVQPESRISDNLLHSTTSPTVIRSVGKNIAIENPRELVDFLSEFGGSTWKDRPYDHAFVIGNKKLVEPLSSQNLKNVKLIFQNLSSIDEGQVSFLINTIAPIPHRSVCFLAFDLSLIIETTMNPGCKKFKCKQPVSGSCLKAQSHSSQQMNIIARIKEIVNLAAKIASYVPVILLPIFPSKIFVDDGRTLHYHKISHAIKDKNFYVLIGERAQWRDSIAIFLQTWNNFTKVYHHKSTFPKTIPKYPYLKDLITIRDTVKEFFEEDDQPIIWENAVKKIIKILMSYNEGNDIEKTITITNTEKTTNNSNIPPLIDISYQPIVKVWNFSDSIPEKFFDFLFKLIDPKADIQKSVENNESSYLVKLTNVSANLICSTLDNILIGDSTLRVSIILNQDNFPEVTPAQEMYITSMFKDAYSRFKSQILKNIKNKLLNVVDFTNYKVSICKNTSCENPTGCNFYHGLRDRRRNPLIYSYRSKMCGNPVACYNGDSCLFARSIYEQIYFPNNFQTLLCSVHDNKTPITNGFCRFAHKNSPEMFFTSSWQDIVTFGSQNSLRFLFGAFRAIHKLLAVGKDVKICFITQSEEFLETAFKIADNIAFPQYKLKCVNLEKMRQNTDTYNVYFGKPSTVNNSGNIISTIENGVLIVENIKNILEDLHDAEHLLEILKMSTSTINKVFVSTYYDPEVTGVVSRFLGIPLQEVKDSDIHPEPKLTTDLDFDSYLVESSKDALVESSLGESSKDALAISSRYRSLSRSRSRDSRSSRRRSKSRISKRRSRSRSWKKRSRSRSLKRRSRSRSFKKRSRSRSLKRRSRSRSLNRRSRSRSFKKRSRSRSLKRRSRSRSSHRIKSRSRARKSRSISQSHVSLSRSRKRKSRSHSITKSHRKRPDSPESLKYTKRKASPESAPQISMMAKLNELLSKESHVSKKAKPNELGAKQSQIFQSSSKMSLEDENIPSIKTLGEEMYRKFLAKKASIKKKIEDEFKAYKAFPELHPDYEMHYEEFLACYYKGFGMNTTEDHKEGLWIILWGEKAKELKKAELNRKTKELEKEFLSKAQARNVENVKGGTSQKMVSASPDTFSIENTLNLLEELSSELGVLGPSIVAIINSVREHGPTTDKRLSIIINEENLVLIKMVIEKMNSLQKKCPSSRLPRLIKGVEWTKKLIEVAKNPPKERGLNLMAIAQASVGKDSEFTLKMIKTALAYEGMTSLSKEEINQLFLKVCSIHFKMSMQEK